jgi:hypothetical protein
VLKLNLYQLCIQVTVHRHYISAFYCLTVLQISCLHIMTELNSLFLLSHIHSISEKILWCGGIENLMDLHVSSPRIWKSDFWCAWMCTKLVTEQLDRFHSHSVFKRLSITERCLVKYEHSSFKNMSPSNKLINQNGDFLENSWNNFDQISVPYGDNLPK